MSIPRNECYLQISVNIWAFYSSGYSQWKYAGQLLMHALGWQTEVTIIYYQQQLKMISAYSFLWCWNGNYHSYHEVNLSDGKNIWTQCIYFWSTIILHRLSQDLIGNSKYDYSLRKPPMCSCLFVCTVHLFYEGRYGLNIRTWAPKDRDMIYKKAWWVSEILLCKFVWSL